MSSLVSRSNSYDSLINYTHKKLKQEKKQLDTLNNCPDSTEALSIKKRRATEAERDEIELRKLAQVKDAVSFNEDSFTYLNNEQVVIQGNKIAITQRDNGETLYELAARGDTLMLKTPARREPIEQMATLGMVKQTKWLPVVIVKKEELFSTLRKALLSYKEKIQSRRAIQDDAASINQAP